jgi:serine/threonine-protein kinase
MAPEQVQGRPTDHRTDVYSLGVTCYHLLAGEPPFRGATAFDVAVKHVQEEPRPLADLCPDLPPDLCGMVQRMMAKNPEDRYQSARDILRDLAKVRDGIAVAQPAVAAAPVALSLSTSIPNGVQSASTGADGTATLAATTAMPVPRPPRWRPWVLAGVACALAAAAGVVAFVARHPTPEPHPQPAPAVPPPGLADVRPPEKLVTTRERELLALLASRQTSPDRYLKGAIELGMLHVQARRLDEAKELFERLEREVLTPPAKKPDRLDPDLLAGRSTSMAGRLGQAVALAYRDTPQAAQASIDLAQKVVNEPYPKVAKLDKGDRGALAVSLFLLRHPDLAEAVADALDRDAATLGKAALGPTLDPFRTPPRGAK